MKGHDPQKISVFWFRRDLRLADNHGLAVALESGRPVIPLFIFDDHILSLLEKRDARVEFIRLRLEKLHAELRGYGSGLHVFRGKPEDVWKQLFKTWKIESVFCNEDYEPQAIARDLGIAALAKANGAEFHSFKDQVVFAKNEVTKDSGDPYRVFTPYSRRWKAELRPEQLAPHGSSEAFGQLSKSGGTGVPSLAELGFEATGLQFSDMTLSKTKLREYADRRNLLAEAGTSRFGLHLRFGTVSARRLTAVAREFSETFLNELIWREFFQQILFHFPKTVSEPFDARYAGIRWRESDGDFERWCAGRTGFPVVDAGMRELQQTGFMHNRARMITASFLCKHLLIDWRRGERHFAKLLLDFDLSANVGNWQWVAGCGCDAAPYFRVFNPALQAKKFDPEGNYVRHWVPEFGTKDYPEPMVDHEMARRRALLAYQAGLKGGGK